MNREFAALHAATLAVLTTTITFIAADALAQSHEALMELCKNTAGRPAVIACMAGQKGPPTPACMAKGQAAGRAC